MCSALYTDPDGGKTARRFRARTHSAAAGLLSSLVHGLMKNGTPVQEEYGKWPINHRKREDSPLRSRALHLFQRTEAGFDGLARANLRFLRARWSVDAADSPGGICNQAEISPWRLRVRFGKATSSSRSSRVRSPSTPGHRRPSVSDRSIGRQATACASSWSTRSAATSKKIPRPPA